MGVDFFVAPRYNKSMLLFLKLIFSHFLCDFVLQNDTMAVNKNRNANTALQKSVPYYYWLLAHSIMHGGFAFFFTGSIFIGVAETLLHYIIDFGKCEGKYSIHTDQILHILCKLAWVAFVIV